MTGLLLAAALASAQAPTVQISPVSGQIRLKPPGGAFAPLTMSEAVPYGTTVDATHGLVKVAPGAAQKAIARGAVFTVTQGDGVTVLQTASCRGTFTISTPSGGFTTRTGKLQVTARKSAKWQVSKHCHKLTVLRGTVIGG